MIDGVNALGPDDWLESMHILLFMNNTVIMTTSKEKMQTKLDALKAKADEIPIYYSKLSQQRTLLSG
jgi:hypothetical protein